jgi:hypothetical protein
MPPFIQKEIIKPFTVSEMVDAFETARLEVTEAYTLLRQAQDRLEAAFGTYTWYGNMATVDRDINWYKQSGKEYAKEIMNKIQRSAWSNVVERLGIRKTMTLQRREELKESLRNGNMPDFNIDEVFALVKKFSQDIDEMGKEVLLEAYKVLRPTPNWRHQYKTNVASLKKGVGKKVIFSNAVGYGYSGQRWNVANQYREDALAVVDRAFHLLDAGGISDAYKSDLVDAINTCSPDGVGETKYFKFKCHSNMNLHLEFKRMDLVAELNRICAGMVLPEEQA